MSTMQKRLLCLAALSGSLLLLAACGDPSTDAGTPRTGSTEHEQREPNDLEAPPPVTVKFSGGSIELKPWTYCYGSGCADGAPPPHLQDVGSPEEVIVEYPLEGWSFTASFATADDRCPREFPAALEEIDEGRFLLRPAGYPDTYDVTLMGRGDGDLFTTFRWTTTSQGPLPTPKARLAVLANHDGEVDSYGVELALTHLARSPAAASATITVRAANGDAVTFEAKPAGRGCWPEGTLYWDGPDAEGLRAAELPGERFTYEVELRLDGERYEATAVWPDDVIRGNEPSVRLGFDPALPALD